MKKVIASVLSIALFGPTLTFAQASDDLMNKLKAMETFESTFTQRIKDEKDKVLNESQGYLQVKRPGRFYWKSEYPDELLVVADGHTIWTYDIELEQIVKQDQAESMGQSPAAILAGEVVDLGKEYKISYATETCSKSVDVCYILVPKSDNQFKQIKIGFDGDNLKMIYMHDALDQSIDTRFNDIKLNQEVNDDIFDFSPPDGVDVIQGNQ